MGIEIVFLIKAIFFGFAAIILIPKEKYRKFLVYGLIFGGIGDILLILIVGRLLGGFQYRNLGVFNILNVTSFWSPLAWMFVKMFFFYGLPLRKHFFYLYILAFGFFGYCVGLVLENFGLFHYSGIYRYLAPFVLTGWFYLAAWLYMKLEKIGFQ